MMPSYTQSPDDQMPRPATSRPSLYPQMEWEGRKRKIIDETLAQLDMPEDERRTAILYPSMVPEVQQRLAAEKARFDEEQNPRRDQVTAEAGDKGELSPQRPGIAPAAPLKQKEAFPSEEVPTPTEPPAPPASPAQVDLSPPKPTAADPAEQADDAFSITTPTTPTTPIPKLAEVQFRSYNSRDFQNQPLTGFNTSDPAFIAAFGSRNQPPTDKYIMGATDWANWHAVMDSLGVQGEERLMMLHLYATEGGERKNNTPAADGSYAVSGITASALQEYLRRVDDVNFSMTVNWPKKVTVNGTTYNLSERSRSNLGRELKGERKANIEQAEHAILDAEVQALLAKDSSTLTPIERAAVMRFTIRHTFRNYTGGYEQASRDIGDSRIMLAIVDICFRLGDNAGGVLIQKAIAAADPNDSFAEEHAVGTVGNKSLGALAKIAKTPEGRAAFWAAFEKEYLGSKKTVDDERDRINHFME